MKSSVLILALMLLCPWARSFAAGKAEDVRKESETSFNRLLNKLTEEYEKGLQVPAPAARPEQAQPDDRYWVTVKAVDKYERTKLLEAGLAIEEIRPGSVSGTMHKNSLPLLSQKGFVVESRKTLAQYLWEDVKDFPAADSAYNNYEEATAILKAAAAKNSDIASLFSLGKTIEGRDIWTLRVNTSAKGEAPSAKPGAFYIGTHHAREHLATEVPLLFAVWLLDNRNSPEIKKYIETLDIYITPILNPDGLEYDIRGGRDRMHRKNARVNADKTIGVDLNRNYDSWWCTAGSSSYPGADTYCGTAPFSEPETQAVKRFVEARKNLKTLMSYHSFSDLILYPWGGKDAQVEDERDRKVFVKMAGEMAAVTGYTPQLSSDLYVATGDTADWAYKTGKIFAFTTELEGGSFYPGAGIIARTVKNNVKAAVYMLSVSDDPYKIVK